MAENRSGAGGNIAAELVAKSPPDGYTLLLGNQGILATNASLYSRVGFDPVKDFAPVILIASQPNVLVVHPSLPVKSAKDLIALARRNPGQLNFSCCPTFAKSSWRRARRSSAARPTSSARTYEPKFRNGRASSRCPARAD